MGKGAGILPVVGQMRGPARPLVLTKLQVALAAVEIVNRLIKQSRIISSNVPDSFFSRGGGGGNL